MIGARKKSRQPRQLVSQQIDDEDETTESSGSNVKRPHPLAKKSSSSRLSFGVSPDAAKDDENEAEFVPKKSSLSRKAIESSARKFGLSTDQTAPPNNLDQATLDPGASSPGSSSQSYNKDYLKELRTSTPSTPHAFRTGSITPSSSNDDPRDVHGEYRSLTETIPNELLIKAIKEKRARGTTFADDEDGFISLGGDVNGDNANDDDDDEEDEELRKVYINKNVLEDGLEGVREYMEEENLLFDKGAESARQRKHRADIREAIDEAELAKDEDSEDSEELEWELHQTSKGTYAKQAPSAAEDQTTLNKRLYPAPTHFPPLPTLTTVLERLQHKLTEMRAQKSVLGTQIADIAQQKADIASREVAVNENLEKASRAYERLQQQRLQTTQPTENGTPSSRWDVKPIDTT